MRLGVRTEVVLKDPNFKEVLQDFLEMFPASRKSDISGNMKKTQNTD